MAYFEDLSIFSYDNRNHEESTYNVGWLEGGKDFPKGDVPQNFIENLWEYIKYPIYQYRGFHYDEILQGDKYQLAVKYEGYTVRLGFTDFRVYDSVNDRFYASPSTILYYIIKHKYLPPACFIDAVMNSPKPNSKEYCEAITKITSKPIENQWGSNKCDFCGSKNLEMGFGHNGSRDKNRKLELIELTKEENLKEFDERSNYYDMICTSCGKSYSKKWDV